MQREQLIAIVKKLMNNEGSEEEQDQLLDSLRQHVPHPQVSDLIFWDQHDRSAEQIVEEALRYKPIIL